MTPFYFVSNELNDISKFFRLFGSYFATSFYFCFGLSFDYSGSSAPFWAIWVAKKSLSEVYAIWDKFITFILIQRKHNFIDLLNI